MLIGYYETFNKMLSSNIRWLCIYAASTWKYFIQFNNSIAKDWFFWVSFLQWIFLYKKMYFFIVSELYSITICSLEFVKSWKSHRNTWLELLLCFPTQNVPIPNNYYFGLWEINQKIPFRGDRIEVILQGERSTKSNTLNTVFQ